jgi:hypothetical protein
MSTDKEIKIDLCLEVLFKRTPVEGKEPIIELVTVLDRGTPINITPSISDEIIRQGHLEDDAETLAVYRDRSYVSKVKTELMFVCDVEIKLEVLVDFSFEEGEEEVYTYSNGDPGHQGFPDRFNIYKVWILNDEGRDDEIELYESLEDEIVDILIE